MHSFKRFIFFIVLALAICGCRKERTGAESTEIEGNEETRKEAVMGMTLQWLGHASFKICDKDTVIYIDPWKLDDSPHDATLVLVSHSHYDHYSPDDIAKVSGSETKLVASSDVITKAKAGEVILPGLTVDFDNVKVSGVAAYNPNKQFHPKTNKWAGFVIEIGNQRIYYAGDTDLTAEMKALKDIDIALLPVGGTYTMNAAEAAEAAQHINPKRAIPYHWGDIVGGRADAEKFAAAAECEVQILSPGETISLE